MSHDPPTLLTRILFGLGLLACTAAHADGPVLPTNPQVVAGAASVSAGNAQVTVNQSSQRAVIDWNTFSVGQGAGVNFNMPATSSAVLNRVTSDTTSAIAGTVSGNGQVYLVNPNGIAITESGQVKVGGGFVASTLNVSNDDFVAGKLKFAGRSGAAVSNDGTISAGEGGAVALLSNGSVSNSGVITVSAGRVALGTGSAITLDPNGTGFMQILAPSSVQGSVDVSGAVTAAGGRIQVQAAAVGQAVRDLVHVSGTLNVTSVREEGGTIILDAGSGGVSLTGRVDASSEQARGGHITIGGNTIDLQGAKVLAVGTNGGQVLVGGGPLALRWPDSPRPMC